MAFQDKEIPTNAAANSLFNKEKRVNSYYEMTVSVGTDAAATALATLTPMGFNSTTQKWGKWLAPDPAILTVDIDGSTGGTWGMTVDSLTIANTVFAYNATAAVVQEALRAEGYDATVVLDTGVYTITFGAETEITNVPTLTGDVTQLTGGTTPTATPTAGTSTYGLHNITGFLFPEAYTLSATEDTMVTVSISGEYYYDDIEANVAVADQAALKTALRNFMIQKGIVIQGLTGIV